ncbi:MAG TPA: phage tail sheath C-terminal domain-containing protein [Thermoanaerobaculia bacterium]|nr:phage tail sheath C-terminal domain-containing protein [Thermoanaerobaculia bacterium]
MPEYLAPGVYVEEIDVGVRPIEGVSTSTAGMVGLTERGPVNVPLLVTSFGEYERLFGGYLDFALYGDHGYLPHAVEGFFQNGGKRLYVTRVVANQPANTAAYAALTLFDRGEQAGVADTRLLKNARAGDTLVLAENTAGLANSDPLRVGDGSTVEYLELAAANAVVPSANRLLALRIPLYFAHLAGENVTEIALAAPALPADQFAGHLEGDHARGARLLILDPADPNFANVTPGGILEVGTGADREYVTVQNVPVSPAGRQVLLDQPLGRAHADNAVVNLVEEGATTTQSPLSNRAESGDGLLGVDATAGLAAGDVVRLQGVAGTEYHVLATFHPVSFTRPAFDSHPQGEPVRVVTMNATGGPGALNTTLQVETPAGERTLLIANVGPLLANHWVRIGAAGPTEEFHQLAADPVGSTITLRHGLALPRPAGAQVERVDNVPGAATFLTQDAGLGETTVFLAESAGFGANTLVEIGTPGTNAVEYQRLTAASLGVLVFAGPLAQDHRRGSLAGRRDPLLTVEALDPGEWGNELRVIAEDDSRTSTIVTTATLPGQPVPLASLAGIEVGTVLDFGGQLAKVTALAGNQATLQPAGAPFAVALGDPVRSREFRLRIQWIRNGRVVRDEALRHLSLDQRHSRYVETIAGLIGGPLRAWDRRPEGQSDYIRVDDLATPAQSEALIRLGPDVITEAGLGGRLLAVGRALTGGTNPLAGVVPATYIGVDDADPLNRTGLQALRNERRVSIVAIPGRTDIDTQAALIAHCETERYRFAVLDSVRGAIPLQGAPIPDVVTQRNQYDTRYAALYYPWLVVRNPFANQPGIPLELALPPSGHVIGVYARTDQERGVHKAPANAVVRGIRGFQRRLNQSEQDILNPSPTNINALRDFRDNGRGLRVWGARCITSDTDWKYVNVRRLFIFLEQSLDEGTQWVVFEPNDLPLWARVRQSIANFLTRVWRDGALQGATPEEAFFVKCDRSTMTQDDIDNGRLIVMVGVAPVKPAEFVIIRIFQATLEATSV